MNTDKESWGLLVRQAGHKLFDTFDDNERAAAKFGLHPHQKTMGAIKSLLDENPLITEVLSRGDLHREMAVGVYEACDQRGGGMKV